ncbi:hypothetical protein FA15DRAFT_752282 [Coprinopsis marcescibilis]|uniref:Uncharacterized protein n=1 Tax=Coprinopsis marcescibilis TaxID=230819 RepID=A0A5C3LAW2_COPMA|nr:hypothetical protein FA15DRAFT_752282 [Coprinopsis marcescibilis]
MRIPTPLLLCLAALHVSAQQSVSLFLPFDPQPFSADVAGVDGESTTYIIHKGSIGPDDLGDGFFGTATLVQGPNGASFTYEYAPPEASTFTMGLVCNFVNGEALCEAVNPENSATETGTLSLEYLDVPLGTTGIPAAGPEPTGFVSSPSPSAGESTARPGSGSQASAAPRPSNTSGAATRGFSGVFALLAASALVLAVA